MKRRAFLHGAGLSLLALGNGDRILQLPARWQRAAAVLAESSARKLAFLVGIDRYSHLQPLRGCATDVQRQRELLLSRFGFQPSDVLTLTNEQAEREAIETAFTEHLIEQARTGDVVVIHFSGYGSQVPLHTGQIADSVASLIPVDGNAGQSGETNHLLLETLALLARSLSTDKVTLVLDTSHNSSGQTLQGNLRLRALPDPARVAVAADELNYRNTLRRKFDSPMQALLEGNKLLPGLWLTAAGAGQLAAEAEWGGFSAGLFTYTFTQALWHAVPASSVQIDLARSAQTIERLTGRLQQPQLSGRATAGKPLYAYYLQPDAISADGAIAAIEKDGTAVVRLDGLPLPVVREYGSKSLLAVVAPDREGPIARLKVSAREGAIAKTQLLEESERDLLAVGQRVREALRVLPRDPGLTVALDPELGRIERVDATSALNSFPEVSAVVAAGESAADCLFGKVPAVEGGRRNSILDSGYSLFSIGGVPFPNSVGAQAEAVKSAVYRLAPKLKTLLAAKLWRLTANEGSSQLGLRATLEAIAPDKRLLLRRQTLRPLSPPFPDGSQTPLALANNRLPLLSVREQICYRVENYDERPLYLLLLGIDSGGNAIALLSPQPDSADAGGAATLNDITIAPGTTRLLPDPAATSFEWIVPGPVGLAEIYVIASTAPFEQTRGVLAATPHPRGEGERIVDLDDPLEVARALQQDLQSADAEASATGDSTTYALASNSWATLGFVYQVG
ncbi:caspase domain protein [Rubidibacter lacunae KORDI 51-2]|uniref:Caspase domain protein n=1 Tax=Rubidibacter lacunae KORDI 51-2 TaxID=582515 RepID=U5DJV4_9CHRO|nr:caspase family protein [Rubidibacter lacunae]ERN39965.1 caspase domain protein [Rubidibacter lacunae KORDI 51-2]